jgi:hypothetical protein
MRRDRDRSSGSVQNRHYDYYEDIEEEQDGDSELVKTIKRLRKNKINCQPRSDLSVDVQAMMIRGPMSMMDAYAAVDNEYAAQAAAAQDGRSPPSSPIPIPPRKRGGKKRSTKKRTNTKKRSYKKQTNTKKRSYKKRN